MNISELSDKVYELSNSWEHFKNVNDERLSQVETKGMADPLTVNQLNKINDAMDEQKSKISMSEPSG